MNAKAQNKKSVLTPANWEAASWSAPAKIRISPSAKRAETSPGLNVNGRDTLKGDAFETAMARQVNIDVLTMTRTCYDRPSGLCLGRRTLAGFIPLSHGIA
jgi:hypothetical protein